MTDWTDQDKAKECRATYAEVDLAAIGHNTALFCGHLPQGCRMMAVVKADGYGHGAVAVAGRALACGATWLGVALAQEALALRAAGIEAPILVFGHTPAESYAALIAADVCMTVYTMDQGLAMAAAARDLKAKTGTGLAKPAKVHLKVDSGMGRIGFLPGPAAEQNILALAATEALVLEGCFTHFARADEEDETCLQQQLAVFLAFVARLKERGLVFALIHSANTAAAMHLPSSCLDMVRIGIGLYGLYPSVASRTWLPGLKPALAWKSYLSHVKVLPAGAGVSYGHTWHGAKETLVGTVAAGYADGVDRHLSNQGWVLVRGQRVPIIGRVCMDQFMVDLSAAPEAIAGDEVVLLGSQETATVAVDDWADQLATINYEIICRISHRVPRRYRAGV